jgi:hypothetical protein
MSAKLVFCLVTEPIMIIQLLHIWSSFFYFYYNEVLILLNCIGDKSFRFNNKSNNQEIIYVSAINPKSDFDKFLFLMLIRQKTLLISQFHSVS